MLSAVKFDYLILRNLPKKIDIPPATIVVDLSSAYRKISDYPHNNLNVKISKEDLLYLIFTSGSTGQPKGVKMSNGALMHYLAWYSSRQPFQGKKVLQFAPFSFDMVFQEMFAAWIDGGELVLIPNDVRNKFDELAESIVKLRIQKIFVPYNALVELASICLINNIIPYDLEYITVFGESFILNKNLKDFFDKIDCIVENLYGSTEVQVISVYRIKNYVHSKVPIGNAVGGNRVYLLDEKLHFQRNEGILCVSGPMLFSGYFNGEELNKKKLIPNRFKERDDVSAYAKLYITGDLAKYLPDGNIEYIGRVDHQVKIRGYRIELDQIEQTILSYDSVKQTVVLVEVNSSDRKDLVAYIQLSDRLDNASQFIEKIKTHIAKQLPFYMVPSHFCLLNAFPLTPTGKINKKLLAATDYKCMSQIKQNIKPKNQIEKEITAIFLQTLNINFIKNDANFFHLGGDSLKITEVILSIQNKLKKTITFREFFASPTVSGISKLVEGKPENDEPKLEVRKQSPPLSFQQERIFFLHNFLIHYLNVNIFNMSYVVDLHGDLDIVILNQSINELIERHTILRTVVKKAEVYQTIVKQHNYSIRIKNLDHLDPKQQNIDSIIEQIINFAFDLSQWPLFHVTLLDQGDKNFTLIFLFHHIILDEWSIRIFAKALSEIYTYKKLNKKSVISKKTSLQYYDFCYWQNDYGIKFLYEKEFAYWKRQLEGLPLKYDFPVDKPIIEKVSKSCFYCFLIKGALYSHTKHICTNNKVTLFMLLLAVYKVLLYKYCEHNDIYVCVPFANRNFHGSDNMMGCFVNMVLLRTKFSENISFAQLLASIKQTVMEAYEHQNLPISILMKKLGYTHCSDNFFHFHYELRTDNEFILDFPGVIVTPFNNHKVEYGKEEFIHIEIEYSKDLYYKKSIMKLAHDFIRILKEIVHNPAISIQDICLADKTVQSIKFTKQADSGCNVGTNVLNFKAGSTQSLGNDSYTLSNNTLKVTRDDVLQTIININKLIKFTIKNTR